jgi:hypothetical protein
MIRRHVGVDVTVLARPLARVRVAEWKRFSSGDAADVDHARRVVVSDEE